MPNELYDEIKAKAAELLELFDKIRPGADRHSYAGENKEYAESFLQDAVFCAKKALTAPNR